MLYPLVFKPQFVEKVWGGKKIQTMLQLENLQGLIGEAWMISGVEGKESVVMNGYLEGNNINELIEIYMGELLGEVVYEQFGNSFPILLKILDAHDYLSMQVHPPHNKKKGEEGKSELWYILEADEGAKLYLGFKKDSSRQEVLDYIKTQQLDNLLNTYQAKDQDLFFIPAGRIHALGPGLLLAEIQQTSDTTYRLSDWDRTDRETHIEKGLQVLDYSHSDDQLEYTRLNNMTNELGDFDGFKTNLIILDKPLGKDYENLDSFVIYLVVEGSLDINAMGHSISLQKGYSVLLPAECNEVELYPHEAAKLLEISI